MLSNIANKYNIEYIRKGYDENNKKIIHCNAFISNVRESSEMNSIILSDNIDCPSIMIVLDKTYNYKPILNRTGYTILLDKQGNERLEFTYKN